MASGGQWSPDRQWWWNGREWVPASQAPPEAYQPQPEQAPGPPSPSPAPAGKGGRGSRRGLFAVLAVIAVLVVGTCLVAVVNSAGSKPKPASTSTPVTQGGVTGPPQAAATPALTPAPKFASFGDGAHRMGSDIQAGTYRTRRGSSGCYFARLKGFGGTVGDIVANGNSDAPVVVTIQPTDAGFQSTSCGTWTQDLSRLVSGSTFGDGDWIIGTDIQPGTYRNSGGAGCYYARLRGFGHTVGDVIANNNTDTPAVIAIDPADKGFEAARCGTWSKV